MDNNEMRNKDVPVETIFKWKQVECWKLRNQVEKLKATVKALQRNIDMLLKDKELRREVAKERLVRTRNIEVKTLTNKLHRAYASIEWLINEKLKLQQKLDEYEQKSV